MVSLRYLIILSLFIFACDHSYKESFSDGTIKLYAEKDGLGRQDGITIHYFESGKPKKRITYDQGFKQGETIDYFENGQIMSKYYYDSDILNGRFQSFYEDGNLSSAFFFDNGEKRDSFYVYHPNQQLFQKGFFFGDTLNFVICEYNEDGSPLGYYYANNGIEYAKTFKDNTFLRAKFPLTAERINDSVLFTLKHSMLPKDRLAVGISFYGDFINKGITSDGNKIIVSERLIEKYNYLYFFEMLLPDSTIQGHELIYTDSIL
jgi:hypothetical protein